MSGRNEHVTDIVIVVMDCVRASDFPQSTSSEQVDCAISQLRRESVVFRRAVAPSPWTVPSHASLFTGAYPWDHQTHNKGRSRLDSTFPTIASILKERGYRTLALSANAFLTPSSGLLQGFEQIGWGRWSDPFIRSMPGKSASFIGNFDEGAAFEKREGTGPDKEELRTLLTTTALRFPITVDSVNRVLRKVVGGSFEYRASPWIEHQFNDWMAKSGRDERIFAFINLIDAHDPYLTDPGAALTLRDWFGQTTISQQPYDLYLGRWKPSEKQKTTLHALYVHGVNTVMRRVANLIGILKCCNRWDNTLFILTSDHGNAFAEDGLMFHGLNVTEPLARIPLWIRFPASSFAGTEGVGWASLVDVLPTIAWEVGIKTQTVDEVRGVPLKSLIDSDRTDPVLIASDGIQSSRKRRRFIPNHILNQLDRVWVGVYFQNRKLVFDASGRRTTAFSTRLPDDQERDVWPLESENLEPLRAIAQDAGDAMLRPHLKANDSSDVIDDRLSSWGYI